MYLYIYTYRYTYTYTHLGMYSISPGATIASNAVASPNFG